MRRRVQYRVRWRRASYGPTTRTHSKNFETERGKDKFVRRLLDSHERKPLTYLSLETRNVDTWQREYAWPDDLP